jgi:hypothetical protein
MTSETCSGTRAPFAAPSRSFGQKGKGTSATCDVLLVRVWVVWGLRRMQKEAESAMMRERE